MRSQFLLLAALILISSCFADADEATPPTTNGPATSTAQSAAAPLSEPFSEGDFSWAPANYAPADSVLATKYFVPEIRFDESYHYARSRPSDDTISGSSEAFRHAEFQTSQIGLGGDFKYNDVGIRFMTQFGMYSETTPRNDSSPSRGQWNLDGAYRYISEGYVSYHLNVLHGINIQTGIFMSYIGLWSYYNFDNWTYQPSYVSSNTPWFFNGARIQVFTSDKLKIEPWLVNGWQSYGRFNHQPGIGLQVQWRPDPAFQIITNQYYGADTLGVPGRHRAHTDDSAMYKYYENQKRTISKAAMSFTFDAGCEDGGGVTCGRQFFLGAMAYNRLWLDHDRFGLTFGGGAINNPGRYLVLLPPVNGATAATGTPYFTENPGDSFWAWDSQLTGDYMPTRNITFRLEYNHRWASAQYFEGHGGMTPPGGNTGTPATTVAGFAPDLQHSEDRLTAAMMVRF